MELPFLGSWQCLEIHNANYMIALEISWLDPSVMWFYEAVFPRLNITLHDTRQHLKVIKATKLSDSQIMIKQKLQITLHLSAFHSHAVPLTAMLWITVFIKLQIISAWAPFAIIFTSVLILIAKSYIRIWGFLLTHSCLLVLFFK